jgi:hypothetical protein
MHIHEPTHYCRGTSLLEALLSLALLGALCTAVCHEFHQFLREVRPYYERAVMMRGLVQSYARLHADFLNLHRARIPVAPFIGNGALTFRDGTLIPLNTKQAPGSQWWALYRSAALPLFDVTITPKQGAPLTATLCHPRTTAISQQRDAFALSDGGMQEVGITLKERFFNAARIPCVTLQLTAQRQVIIADSSSWPLSYTVGLQLLDEKFIYMIDATHQLRRIQIRNEFVIENQPCLSQVPPDMTLSYKLPSYSYVLTCEQCPRLMLSMKLHPVSAAALAATVVSLKRISP